MFMGFQTDGSTFTKQLHNKTQHRCWFVCSGCNICHADVSSRNASSSAKQLRNTRTARNFEGIDDALQLARIRNSVKNVHMFTLVGGRGRVPSRSPKLSDVATSSVHPNLVVQMETQIEHATLCNVIFDLVQDL